MDVIRFTIYFNKFSVKVLTDLFKDHLHCNIMGFLENTLPVFCHKDQMNMNIENTMPACSNIA